MPTLQELRSSIRNQCIGQVGTDDTRLRARFIDKLIRDKRSVLIKRSGDRGLGVDQAYYQELRCLKIQEDEIVCEGYRSGVRHKYVEVPALESFPGSVAYLGTVDGKTQFMGRGLTAFLNAIPGRFCHKKPVYSVIGDRAYLKFIPHDLKVLRLFAVLEDPSKNTCITDFEVTMYPIPNNQVHTLEVMAIKQLLATIPIEPDTTNDAADRAIPQGRANANVE